MKNWSIVSYILVLCMHTAYAQEQNIQIQPFNCIPHTSHNPQVVSCKTSIKNFPSQAHVHVFSQLGTVKVASHSIELLVPVQKRPKQEVVIFMGSRASTIDKPDIFWTASLTAPVFAPLTLKGKTEKSAQVYMEVGSQQYGPVQANQKGKFTIDVLVPPQVSYAQAKFIDLAGNISSKSVALFPPKKSVIRSFSLFSSVTSHKSPSNILLIAGFDAGGRSIAAKYLSATTTDMTLHRVKTQSPVAVYLLSAAQQSSNVITIAHTNKQSHVHTLAKENDSPDHATLSITPSKSLQNTQPIITITSALQDETKHIVKTLKPMIFLEDMQIKGVNHQQTNGSFMAKIKAPKQVGQYHITASFRKVVSNCTHPIIIKTQDETCAQQIITPMNIPCVQNHQKDPNIAILKTDPQGCLKDSIKILDTSYAYIPGPWPWIQVKNQKKVATEQISASQMFWVLPNFTPIEFRNISRTKSSISIHLCSEIPIQNPEQIWIKSSCGTASNLQFDQQHACLFANIDISLCNNTRVTIISGYEDSNNIAYKTIDLATLR